LLVDFGFNHNCGRGLMGMGGALRQGDKVLLMLFIVAQLLDSGGDRPGMEFRANSESPKGTEL
jgi:hypothetical protein